MILILILLLLLLWVRVSFCSGAAVAAAAAAARIFGIAERGERAPCIAHVSLARPSLQPQQPSPRQAGGKPSAGLNLPHPLGNMPSLACA